MNYYKKFIQALKLATDLDPILELISSQKHNKFSILRTEAENQPEKLIKSSKKLPQFLRREIETAHLHSFFVDQKEHFQQHFHESIFIAGDSNVEISIQKHTLLQKIFVFNNSKAVIDYRTTADEPKILQIHLYDHAEVYVHAGNNVDVFFRYMSSDAKGTVRTDNTCNVVKSTYNSTGITRSVKVKPGQII